MDIDQTVKADAGLKYQKQAPHHDGNIFRAFGSPNLNRLGDQCHDIEIHTQIEYYLENLLDEFHICLHGCGG